MERLLAKYYYLKTQVMAREMQVKDAVSILKSRKVITRAHIGSYVRGVKVVSCNPVSIEREGITTVAIANFSAHTEYGIAQAKENLGNGETLEALNHGMSLGIRENGVMLQKGMIVDLFITEIENKDGVNILVVDNVRIPEAVNASNSANMFTEFEAEEVDEPEYEEEEEEAAAADPKAKRKLVKEPGDLS